MPKEKRKIIDKLKIILVLTVFVAAFSSEARALENNVVPDIDSDKPLSLTITYVHENDGEGIPLKRVVFYACRVSNLKAKSGSAKYELLKEFYKTGISFENMNAKKSQEAAKSFKRIAKTHKNLLLKGSTNSEGKVIWKNLKPGMYLVYQEKKHVQSGKKYSSSPFLVSVPSVESVGETNIWKYSVEAMPKSSKNEKIPSIPKKPDTGDRSELYIWAWILIISSVFLAFKYYVKKQSDRNNI